MIVKLHVIIGSSFEALLDNCMLSVDDDQWEPDEDFFLKISLCHDQGQRAEESDVAKIGKKHIMTIK